MRKTTLQSLVKLTSPTNPNKSDFNYVTEMFQKYTRKNLLTSAENWKPIIKVQTAAAKTSLWSKQTIRRSTVSEKICTT